MREIKFRAWQPEHKRMVYLDDRHEWQFGKDYWCLANLQFNLQICSQEHSILMQFTGLKDKNGKEIWEGDLVRVQSQYETDEPIDSSPNKVYWDDGGFRCEFHYMLLGEKVCSGSEGNWNMEVIGNIHENSELIGERK